MNADRRMAFVLENQIPILGRPQINSVKGTVAPD
jgi:hypothetical protein